MFARKLFNPIKRMNVKGIHSTSKNQSTSVLKADESNSLVKFYHKSAIALAVLTPLAFIVSPTPLILPVDVLLGVLIPIHSHVAMNYVVADYVPKSTRPLARGLVLVASILAAAGILRLNLEGKGLTETVKSLWRKPAAEKKQ